MSLTSSINVVGASYWTYMAAVVSECLSKVIRDKRIPADIMPKGVYGDAMEFFQLVIQSTQDDTPRDPSASRKAYAIAADALRESSSAVVKPQDIDNMLGSFASFIESFGNPRDLSKDELKLARQLRSFFIQLQEDGENEAYERRFERGAPPVRFPSLVLRR